MKYLVMYDICDDRRRYRVAKLLEAKGIRLQWSVFECTVRLQSELRHFVQCIKGEIDETTDQVRLYQVSDQRLGEDSLVILGQAIEDPMPDVWII